MMFRSRLGLMEIFVHTRGEPYMQQSDKHDELRHAENFAPRGIDHIAEPYIAHIGERFYNHFAQ